MKKIKRLLVLAMSLCMTAGVLAIPVNASESTDLKETIYTPTNGEATVDINEAEVGQTITLYKDAENNRTIEITILEKTPIVSTFSNGDTGWSAGYIPQWAWTAVVRQTELVNVIEYKVDLNHGDIVNAYDLYYSVLGMNLSNQNLQYNSRKASFTFYASTLAGIGGSFAGYLNFEVNTAGQVRTTWRM